MPDIVETPICDLCGDQPEILHLHSACHMTAPLALTLDKDILEVRCYVPTCNRLVAKFRVSHLIPATDPNV